jgi:predicted ArsR family transcriptional regulator
MSYLELAKRSLARSSRRMSQVEQALIDGGRLTVEEVAARSRVGAEAARRELDSLVHRGRAFTAVDIHRRAEVFWSSGS